MQSTVIGLVEALRPRAARTAEMLAKRVPDPGLWHGYNRNEGLKGELRLKDLLVFQRPSRPHAEIVFRNPRMTGLREVQWGDAVVLDEAIAQRFSSHILIAEPVTYRKELSHTFSRTRTLQEQIKAGLEAALKVGAEAGAQGGIHGITAKVYAELSLKLYAEYQRQWGTSTTTSDTVTDEIVRAVTRDELADGPVRLDYEALRSTNREQRTVRADCDYEHSVELIDSRVGLRPEGRPYLQIVCESWGRFRSVMQGFAPRDVQIERDGKTVVLPVGFYDEFIDDPVRGEELERISKPAEGAIEMLLEYDNVVSQSIKVV